MPDLRELTEQDILIFLTVLLVALVMMLLVRQFLRVSFPYFFMGILGLVIGLWIGSRLGTPFGSLPAPYGRFVPMAINIIIAVAIFDLFLAQARPIGQFFATLFELFHRWWSRVREAENLPRRELVVDTSALIDGRIEPIATARFLTGKLVIPKFVLAELQAVADAADPGRRARGRRGLEVLASLQKLGSVEIELVDDFLLSRDPVDQKLIRLAKHRSASLLSVDYNLARVAQIEGIPVLNVNELATALRPQLLPGETLAVTIVAKGKEALQGIGYLPDGTMIVVEGGADHVGVTLTCEVVRLFQSTTGKMVFVEIAKDRTTKGHG